MYPMKQFLNTICSKIHLQGRKRKQPIFCLILSVFIAFSSFGTASVPAKAASYSVSKKEVNAFFGKSLTVGNSIVLGFQRFVEGKEKGYLGGTTVIGQGSYTFIVEFTNDKPFMLHYHGRARKVTELVKETKAKHVFINMGVNDFNTSKEHIFSNYKKYIREIKKANAGTDIYVLATTPTWKPKKLINNKEINKLNKNMENYAKKAKDVYYIDINTPLKGADGRLKESAVSDGFIHLRRTAYEIWVKHMTAFVKKQLKAEKKAKALVKTAKKELTMQTYQNAKVAVDALEKSTLRTTLKKRLKKIKKMIPNTYPTSFWTAGFQRASAASVLAASEEPDSTEASVQSPVPTKIPASIKAPAPTKAPVPTKTPMPTKTPAPTKVPEKKDPAKEKQKRIDHGKWRLKKKHIYYYDAKNKKLKGLVTIRSKNYYFDKKGIQQTGWHKIKGNYYFFRLKNKAGGYMVKNKTVNNIRLSKKGDARVKAVWKKQKLVLMTSCQKIISKITNATMTTNQKLRAAYDYERKHYYIKGSQKFQPSKHWDLVYARRMFHDGHGACYEWGAFYAYLANAAGGKVCAAVTSGGHGWAEVDGRCSDPNWEFADRRHSYFQIDYRLSGVDGRPNYFRNRNSVKRV